MCLVIPKSDRFFFSPGPTTVAIVKGISLQIAACDGDNTSREALTMFYVYMIIFPSMNFIDRLYYCSSQQEKMILGVEIIGKHSNSTK